MFIRQKLQLVILQRNHNLQTGLLLTAFCMHTLSHLNLIQNKALGRSWEVKLRCIHSHVITSFGATHVDGLA